MKNSSIFPAKKSHSQRIKAYLMTGRSINKWQANRLCGTTSLAQRISELKNNGLPIQSELVVRNGKRYSIYWLKVSDIKAINKQRNCKTIPCKRSRKTSVTYKQSDLQSNVASLNNAQLQQHLDQSLPLEQLENDLLNGDIGGSCE